MYAQSHRHRDDSAIVATGYQYRTGGKTLEAEKTVQKQSIHYRIGSVVRFCDREQVIEAEIYDNTVPGQISVIDKQGFLHIGLTAHHNEYEAIAIVSSKEKVKQGYKPAKSNGVALVNH